MYSVLPTLIKSQEKTCFTSFLHMLYFIVTLMYSSGLITQEHSAPETDFSNSNLETDNLVTVVTFTSIKIKSH